MRNLLLAITLVVATVTTGFAQETQTIFNEGNTEVLKFNSDSVSIFTHSENNSADNIDIFNKIQFGLYTQIKDGKVIIQDFFWGLFKNTSETERNIKIDFIFNGDKSTFINAKGWNSGTSKYTYIAGSIGKQVRAADFFHIRVTTDKSVAVYKFDLTNGFKGGFKVFIDDYGKIKANLDNPFAGGVESDNPFQG